MPPERKERAATIDRAIRLAAAMPKALKLAIAAVAAFGASIAVTLMDAQQTDVGQRFADQLMQAHAEYELSAIDFRGDTATISFTLVVDAQVDASSPAYIRERGAEIRDAYCSMVSEFESSGEVEVLNIVVRRKHGSIVLSHALQSSTCA